MIQFSCPQCGKAFNVSDSAAGQRGKCKGCNSSVIVPSPPVLATVPANPDPPLPEETIQSWVAKPPVTAVATASDVPRLVACGFCGEMVTRDEKRKQYSNKRTEPPTTSEVHLLADGLAHIDNRRCCRPFALFSSPQHRIKDFPAVFAFLGLCLLGQLYKGQPINGIVWFIVVVIGYACFIIPGIILHICCIIGAGSRN